MTPEEALALLDAPAPVEVVRFEKPKQPVAAPAPKRSNELVAVVSSRSTTSSRRPGKEIQGSHVAYVAPVDSQVCPRCRCSRRVGTPDDRHAIRNDVKNGRWVKVNCVGEEVEPE